MKHPASNVTEGRVLCVDLDGTLVATDMLWESLLSAIRVHPLIIFLVPLWMLRGLPYLKNRLALAARIDFATLPYRSEVVAFVAAEQRRGRCVVLATASDSILAGGVATHLGLFAEVLASNASTNMKGHTKASWLMNRFGPGNFDYVGNSRADIPCWAAAADAITVGALPARRAKHLRPLENGKRLDTLRLRLRALVKALRVHQWLKNLLLVMPVVAAHNFEWTTAADLGIAFVSLSLCASGGYVLNDLLDLGADRQHPRKRTRPFASGQLSIAVGILMIATMWALGFGLAVQLLPIEYVALAFVYVFSTAAYSVRVKKEPVLDVMFLAGLYVIRVVAGGVATGVPVSTWLLAFTLFVCLSLALLKRYIEVRAQIISGNQQLPGRGYVNEDAQWLQSAGIAAAYLSVVVLAIYVNNADVSRLYSNPDRLLLMCPVLLYWATRTWVYAHRQRLHDDPLVAVASDPVTYVLLTILAVIVFTAV